jgi:hypothetical protein
MYVARRPQEAVDSITGERVYFADRYQINYERSDVAVAYKIEHGSGPLVYVYAQSAKRIDFGSVGKLTDDEALRYAERLCDGLLVLDVWPVLIDNGEEIRWKEHRSKESDG